MSFIRIHINCFSKSDMEKSHKLPVQILKCIGYIGLCVSILLSVACKQQVLMEGDYVIVAEESGEVLTSDQTDIQTITTSERKNSADDRQIWTIEEFGDNRYTIVSKQNGNALSVNQSSTDNGGAIILSDLTYSEAQQFRVMEAFPNASGLFTLLNEGSGKALTMKDGYLEQQTYLMSTFQQWRLEPYEPSLEDLLNGYDDCPSDLSDKINYVAKDSNFPRNGYQNPRNSKGNFTTTAQKHRSNINDLLQALHLAQYKTAFDIATDPARLHLKACKTTDVKDRPILIFKAIAGKTPRAAYLNLLWRVEGANNLILESPHSGSDGDVSFASMRVFYYSSAKAMIMNERDRHSSSVKSGCSGNGGSYEISDVAHAPTSLFHYAHIRLSQLYPNSLFANLHGMGRSGNGISISNGLGYSFNAKGHSALVHFTDRFLKHPAFKSGKKSDFTACQKGTKFARKQRVCGTTNIQGRHLNASTNACTKRGTVDSDRFLHVEQGAYIRRNASRQRALAEVFDQMIEDWQSPH